MPPLLCAPRVCGPLFWRRGDSAAALFWAVGKAKLVMGRRVEQRQKGGKRKTNRRAFHGPSTITPAAKGPGRKAGPATLSKLAFPAGSCRPPPPPRRRYAPPATQGGGSSRHACFCGQDPLTNFPRASPVLAVVVGSAGPGSSVFVLVADSPIPVPMEYRMLYFPSSSPFQPCRRQRPTPRLPSQTRRDVLFPSPCSAVQRPPASAACADHCVFVSPIRPDLSMASCKPRTCASSHHSRTASTY